MCQSCAHLDRSIHQAKAAFPYSGWVAAAIRSFKYGDEWSRAAHLGSLMIPVIEPLGEFDAIVPVPLHAARLRQRGYNQSGLLAVEIGRQLQIPVVPVLARTRDTVSQVTLSREDRQSNLSGAFGLDSGWAPASGTRFLMIDDVRTTGATLNACAKELVRTGPRQVTVATLALDLPQRELHDWLAEYGR